MTDPGFRRGSPYDSFVAVGENTMDDLKGFLQDMTKTIEFLCTRYDTARHLVKTSVFENPDVRTSLSIGMPSVSLRMLPTREEIPRPHFRGDISGFRVPSHPFQPALSSEQLFSRQRFDESKLDQMQRWFAQNSSFDERVRGQKSNNLEERRLIAAICETEAPNDVSGVRTNSQGLPSHAKDGDALRAFLEDMKKTIQAWCATHNLLDRRRAISARRDADTHGAELGEIPEAIRPRSHRLDSDFRVIDHVELGVDRVPFPREKDKDVAVIQVLNLPNQREDEASGSQKDKEEAEAACFIQIQEGKERDNSVSQAEHGKADGNSFVPHDQNASQLPQHGNEPPPQQGADVQEPLKAVRVGFHSCSPIHLEEDPVQHKVVHKEIEVEITPRSDSGEVDNFATPTTDRAETKFQGRILETKTEAINDDSARDLKIQPYRRKVDVVDSPEWLPKGWITEVKTRISGNSAGSKDKYYFDPVSKRRFRSKKEVFCFLETGKLGRYKSKLKINPVKLLETELPSPGQVIDSSEARPTKRMRKTSSKSQPTASSVAGPSTVPAVAPPPGLFSNLFMPYRPGQPSDWLVYESLASLPLPVIEHLRYAEYNRSKSNSNRGPAIRPWFLNNPEGSWRPSVEKSYLGKSAEKGKDVQGLQLNAGAQGFETMSKHSCTEAKKATKRSSS